ncbi:MAG TPA: aspartyl protease family protein [Rhizomicrobium sp.]|jgi:hypothetical protein|nr:aspartyl protease family protein [Rhizomicrobium sp.]
MKTSAAAIAVALIAAVPVSARDLTPEVRAMIFAPTGEVHLAQAIVTIPLKGTDHQGFYKCPYMQVYVNGRGPFTFEFDTGGSYTVVSSKVVAAARAPVVFDRAGHRDVVRLARLAIGGATLNGVWAIQDDTFGVDGVLGFRSFGNSNLLFDLAAHRLTVSASPIPLTKGFELPYEMPFNIPTIPMTIGHRSVPTLIDTGDDAFAWEMRSVEIGDAAFQHPPIAGPVVLNAANEQTTSVTTLVEPLGLGPWHADAPVLAINDDLPVGDIGVDVVSQFRMEFEPSRRVVVFEPLFAGNRFTVPAERTPGFRLAFDGTGTVLGVVPGSAVALAGMARGAKIISVDGRPAAGLDRRAWDARLETDAPLAVRWSSAGTEHNATVPITEMR